MEQNKNQGRQQDQLKEQNQQQNDRNETLRREEELGRTSRQGLTETNEDADAVTNEGKQDLGKQKPMREWDTQETAEESAERFPKPDQPNNRPNTDGGSRQGNQQR